MICVGLQLVVVLSVGLVYLSLSLCFFGKNDLFSRYNLELFPGRSGPRSPISSGLIEAC